VKRTMTSNRIMLFEFPRSSQYSPYVYSIITRTQSSPAVYCVLSTLRQGLHRRDKGTTQKCVTPFGRRRVSAKVNVSGQMFIQFSIPLIF
jgi:hypothetical protein